MRRRRGTVALVAVLISGCGGGDPVDFTKEATVTCEWARHSADVLPERTPQLLTTAAAHLRLVETTDRQRAAADRLVGELGDLSRSADAVAGERGATDPDPARLRGARAAMLDDQRKLAATARTLGVRGCDGVAAVLLREPSAAANADGPARLSRASYRRRLGAALDPLSRRTERAQALISSGRGSPRTLATYAASVGTTIKRLQPLLPPEGAEAAHQDLLAGLRAMRAASARSARQLRAGSAEQATREMTRFFASQSSRDLQAAIAALRAGRYLPGR